MFMTPNRKSSDKAYFASKLGALGETMIGIDHKDRQYPIYLIGRTGRGKSTTLVNFAISNIQAGRGVAVIDPHGDLAEFIIKKTLLIRAFLRGRRKEILKLAALLKPWFIF